MFKIFEKKFNDIETIVSYNITKNILNIATSNLYYDDSSGYTDTYPYFNLMKIDMDKRIEVANDDIRFEPLNLIDNNIYTVYFNRIDIYDIDNLEIENSVKLHNDFFENDIHYIFIQDNNNNLNNLINGVNAFIYNVFNINNEIYYCIRFITVEDEKVIDSKFIFVNLYSNETYLTVNLYSDNISVNNTIINLTFNDCYILDYENTLIFYNNETLSYVKVNIKTNEYKVKYLNDIVKLNDFGKVVYDHRIVGDYKILYQYKISEDINDIFSNKKKIIYDLKNDTFEELYFDDYIVSIGLFNYNHKQYYIIVNDFKDIIIYVRKNDYLKIIDPNIKNINLITIGTEDKNIKVSLDLLKERSYFIKSLFIDIDKDLMPNSLISNHYKNIDLYVDYIVNEKYDDEKLYDLYKICNYMQDTNIEYLAEMIIIYVECGDFDINKSFEYLDLLYTSTCEEQLESLIYVVYKKYNNLIFFNKISDKTLLLNNYIHKVLSYEIKKIEEYISQLNSIDSLHIS